MLELARRFDAAERNALLRILRDHPSLSLADLRLLLTSGRLGHVLRSITIEEYVQGFADPDRRCDPAVKVHARALVESNILRALAGAADPLSAAELLGKTGSDRTTTMAALQRLAAAKKIRRTSKSRVPAYQLR